MCADDAELVIVAHRRAPIVRMLRANLEAEGIRVETTATATGCLTALRAHRRAALVLDADLVRETTPGGETLFAYLGRAAVPVLLVSHDPADRLMARSLVQAAFLSRADDIDQVMDAVCALLARAHLHDGPTIVRR